MARHVKHLGCLILAVLVLATSTLPGMSEEVPAVLGSPSVERFGGPGSVEHQLTDDARRKDSLTDIDLLKSYSEWKESLRQRYGLSFTVDYTTSVLFPTNTISGEHVYASGAVRFYGTWDIVGRGTANPGRLVWKVENRHKIADLPASSAASDIGYVGGISAVHSNDGNRLTNFYWKQNLKEGRLEIILGMLDATDWMDVYPLSSPWNGFVNFNFSTGTATLPIPDDSAIGAFVNAMITDNLYVVTGFVDANADATKPLRGFDTFFNDREYFKVFELGWTTSQSRFYLDNVHVTVWHVDARDSAGVPSGWGSSFSYTHSFFDDKFLPFFRVGYAEGSGSLLQKSVSAGFGYHPTDDTSLIGLGFHWGQPNEQTFGKGLRDQYAMELFARLQVLKNLEVTPHLNFIANPALNPTASESWVLGVRSRLVL